MRDWWGPGVGLASAAVYALDPFSKHYVTILLSEQLAAFLVLAGVFAYTRAVRSRHLGWWAATGALAGSLTLVRAVFVFTVPLVIGAALLQRGTKLRGAVAALACAALLLVPWLAWTNHTTGRAVLANWGQGYNLLVAAHGEGFGRTQTDVSEDRAFVARPRAAASIRAVARATAPRSRGAPALPRARGRRGAFPCGRGVPRPARRRPLQVVSGDVYRAFFLWQAHEDWYQPSGAALQLSCKRSTFWSSPWRSSSLVLALRRGGLYAGVALVLLAYTVCDRDAPHRSAVCDAGARPLPRAHDVRCARAAQAFASVAPPRRNVASQNGAVAGLPTDVMNDCVPPATSPAAKTPSAAAVTRRA